MLEGQLARLKEKPHANAPEQKEHKAPKPNTIKKSASEPKPEEGAQEGQEERISQEQKTPKIAESEEGPHDEKEAEDHALSSNPEPAPEESPQKEEPESISQQPQFIVDVPDENHSDQVEKPAAAVVPKHHEDPAAMQPPKKKSSTLAVILWIIGAIALLGILLFFSITMQESASNATMNGGAEKGPLYACSADTDCKMPAMEYRCRNPATEEAYCDRKNITSVQVTILSTDCGACDPSRIRGILAGWFPGATFETIPSSSEEGEALISSHSITMLPAYIVGTSIEETFIFSDVGNAFRKSVDSYVMKESASGAVLYLNRKKISRTVDVFLSSDEESSKIAVANMQEFIDAFKDEAKVRVRYAKGENVTAQDSNLLKTLGLSTPSFLINNNLRIGGVQAADTLRAHYCERNPSDLCRTELRKSLV